MSNADQHFTTEAGGVPTAPGRFVSLAATPSADFLPGLTFRPVLGESVLVNFVHFEPHSHAPNHVHEEEQIVIVTSGEFTFEIDGEARVMRPGDVAVVPPWVPHGAKAGDSPCDEIDVFSPPRKTLLDLANSKGAQASEPT